MNRLRTHYLKDVVPALRKEFGYTNVMAVPKMFPEIDYLKVDKSRGMNISVVTTAKTDEEARRLLQLVGLPFRQN